VGAVPRSDLDNEIDAFLLNFAGLHLQKFNNLTAAVWITVLTISVAAY